MTHYNNRGFLRESTIEFLFEEVLDKYDCLCTIYARHEREESVTWLLPENCTQGFEEIDIKLISVDEIKAGGFLVDDRSVKLECKKAIEAGLNSYENEILEELEYRE